MHDDDRNLLGPTEGEPPSPEFVEQLWERLGAAWEARDDVPRTSPSRTAIDVTVLDDKGEPMRKNQLWTILGAVAATVIVIGGIVVISNRDDDSAPADPPPTPTTVAETSDVAIDAPTDDTTPTETQAPTTTVTTTTTTPEWPSDRPFEITYIDVDAGSAVAASDEFAWVVGDDTGLLSTIDLATNTVISTAEIPAGSVRAWYAFGSVWIGNDDNTVARFDPDAGEVVATIDVGGLPWWLDDDDDAVWVAARGGAAVRIDPETNTVVARVPTGDSGGTSVNADGVWVRNHWGDIVRIDPATNTVAATIRDVPGNGALTASPDSIWAPLSYRGVVYRIDPSTDSVVAEIDINAAVGADTTLFDLRYVGDSVWLVFRCSAGDQEICSQGIAWIDPVTNEVLAVESLRWQAEWVSGGPDTAWTFSGDAIARIDF